MKQCIIIPVHPPKTNWLMAFLSSMQNYTDPETCPFRIVLAASDYPDYRFFSKLIAVLPCAELIEVFCVEDYIVDTLGYMEFLGRYQRNEKRVIVNAKKFVAMHWAMKQGYHWIACVDSDISAIADLSGLFEALIRNYEAGVYFGHSGSNDPRFVEINSECRKLFREADQPAIEQLTKHDNTYAWFFDVPFYKASDLEEFFADIGSDYNSLEEWFCRLDYFSFEHLIFLFWRCIRQQAVLIDCFEMGIVDIPEYMKFHDLMRIETKFNYRTNWIQFRELMFEPDIAHALAGTFLLFHCDRT